MRLVNNYIELFGDPQENFFSLGKKDKSSYDQIYQQISMLCGRNNILTQLLKISTEYATKLKRKKEISLLDEMNAYAEGLDRPLDDVVFSLLLPELVASFNQWTPQLMNLIPGCSSLFYLDQSSGTPIHARILDYAVSGPFEKYERAIKYDFNGSHQVIGFGSSGMPFPSLTGFNNQGLSLALHYKHGSQFDFSGESIFSITQELLFQCSDIRECLKLLKGKQSIAHWGIYLSDKNKEIVTIDIKGKEIYQEKFDLNDHPYLYFNNRPLLHKKTHSTLQPYGNADQCKMRRSQLKKTMNKMKDRTLHSAIDILTHIPQTKDVKNWNLAPLTPSSIQVVAMNPVQKQAIMVLGEAPKTVHNNVLQLENVFHKTNKDIIKSKKKQNKHHKAYARWSKFQTHLDHGQLPAAYHHIQMAIEEFRGYPESDISQFFFLSLEYIYEGDKRDLSYLLKSFESLQYKLPAYLEDHRQLFVMRISKLIGLEIDKAKFKIKHPALKDIFDKEYELNAMALKVLKKFIFPRIEILDIVYSY